MEQQTNSTTSNASENTESHVITLADTDGATVTGEDETSGGGMGTDVTAASDAGPNTDHQGVDITGTSSQ